MFIIEIRKGVEVMELTTSFSESKIKIELFR